MPMSLQFFIIYIPFNSSWKNSKVYALQKWWEKAWQQKGINIHTIANAKYKNSKWKHNKKA